MEMIQKNKEYIVTIEGYNSTGAGVARIDGRAVFIHIPTIRNADEAFVRKVRQALLQAPAT